MSTVSLLPKARGDIRAILAMTAGQRDMQKAVAIAAHRWGKVVASDVEATMKAAVSAVTVDQIGGGGIATPKLFETALEQSVLRAFPATPFNVPMLASSGEASAYWVGQARPKPLTKTQLTRSTLAPLKIGSIEVFTREALEAVDARAEAEFQRRILRAIVRLINATYLDPSVAAVTNISPASITNGLTPLAYTGDLIESVGNLFEAYGGDYSTAVLMTDPKTGLKLGAATNSAGAFAFPDATVRGGSVLGIPLVVGRGSPRDSSGGQLVIADTAQVAVGLGDLRFDRSTQATLEMDDEPDDPVAAATVQISLFQNDLAALRIEADVNWQVMQDNAVAVLIGIL